MPPIVTWILNRVDEMRAVVPRDVNQLIDGFAGRTTALDEKVTSRMLAPTVVEQRCTTNTTVNSTSETDITGATITLTPAIASAALVVAFAHLYGDTAGDRFDLYLDVDGANEGAKPAAHVPSANYQLTIGDVWVVPLTAAAHTLKLQGVRASGTGTITVLAVNTKLVVILVGDASVTNDASS